MPILPAYSSQKCPLDFSVNVGGRMVGFAGLCRAVARAREVEQKKIWRRGVDVGVGPAVAGSLWEHFSVHYDWAGGLTTLELGDERAL